MAEDAFSLIITEVWSMDPKLEVPRVQKFVNKATILKTIAERKKSSQARSGTPSGSPRVPRALQAVPASDAPTSAAHISGTSESSADRPLETDGGNGVPPRCSLFIVLLFFGSIHILLFGTCLFLFGFLGYFVLLRLLFCYDTMLSSSLILCMLVMLQINVWLNCYLVNFHGISHSFFFEMGYPGYLNKYSTSGVCWFIQIGEFGACLSRQPWRISHKLVIKISSWHLDKKLKVHNWSNQSISYSFEVLSELLNKLPPT